ncbi:MAG: hypothetical protein JXA49_10630 [Actinobacteria bacterium]|nr:hypothetical protein [Actinomycetota bacterium]
MDGEKRESVSICREGLEEYPISRVIYGNTVMLVWIGLGTFACFMLDPIAAWIYLGVSLVTVFIVLRIMVCTRCYYYGKRCHSGWGRLASLIAKRKDIEGFNDGIGVRAAPAVYGLLSLVPLVIGTISAIMDFSILKVIVLAILLLTGYYSGAISRKSACAECKMREFCRGAVVSD